MRIGTQELVIILIIVVLIFGPSQIPKLSRMFGKSMKSFKKGMSEGDEDSAGASETTKKDAEA